jgi:flagellar biosynthesis protein FlhG
VQTAYRIAGQSERVLLLDEASGEGALSRILDLPDGPDLLSVLGGQVRAVDLIQTVPGLIGRVPIRAAALALPLLDEERRNHLVNTLRSLYRYAAFVLIHSSCDAAEDPSPFIFAAPRRLVIAQASRSGATDAYQIIKRLAAAGAGSIHVAISRARNRDDAAAFFASLDKLVQRHVGIPLAWLGEVERDDLARGLGCESAEAGPRESEAAFLRRLSALGRAAVSPRVAGA